MTFAQYIESCRVTETSRGDFIADAKTLLHAGRFPDVKCWGDLYHFMAHRSARPEAIDIARKVWRAYQQSNSLETAS